MRKLASIQVINSITPIPGADKIECAGVLGWDVVIKKGEFQVGDKCIFCEVDSILPDAPEWSQFMRDRHFRVKTCKLRGCLSQGLVFPLSILPGAETLDIDTEVTEQLGIAKYEPQLHNGGKHMGCAAGSFPSGIPKTDEIRLQSKLGLLEELKEAGDFYISVKVDGTSSTFCYDGDEFVCCSRNWKKKEDPDNIYWKMARKYELNEILITYRNLAIQGEIAGPNIQGNKLQLKDCELFVFDIYDREKRRYYDYQDLITFCRQHNLTHVPIETISLVPGGILYSKEDFLNLAEGKYLGTLNDREGIVVRPLISTYSPRLQGRLSFKVLNNAFLLKEK